MPQILSPSGRIWKPLLTQQSLQSASQTKDVSFDFSSYNHYLIEAYIDVIGTTSDQALLVSALLASGSPTERFSRIQNVDTVVSSADGTTGHSVMTCRRFASAESPKAYGGWLTLEYRRPFSSQPEIMVCRSVLFYSASSGTPSTRQNYCYGTTVSASNNFTGIRLDASTGSIFGANSVMNIYFSEDLQELD